ncbi:hypothetical protein BC938DRAFT_480221 [Jimgerdemannia flammicorona]|uniref:Uncharacterized protein n=1 Tax=Jimgerdemannia flammicorona TaxID=994334 RepID=A0A433QXD5_9FUNG|nr:hypothetical protein BC938DRAFT_480221 [Jimgerdemannia flammicorona]
MLQEHNNIYEDPLNGELFDAPEFGIEDGDDVLSTPPRGIPPRRRISTSKDIADELRDVLGDGYDDDAEELPPQTEASVQSRASSSGKTTSASTAEQKSELLNFIRQKETLVESLREQLREQEEELQLLKRNWNRILQEEKVTAGGTPEPEPEKSVSAKRSTATSPSLPPTEEVLANAGKTVVENLGRGFAQLLYGTQKILESDTFLQTKAKAVELSKEAIVNVRGGIVAVAESETFQQTRSKALEISKDTMVNVRDGFTAVTESETFLLGKQRTLAAIETAVHTAEAMAVGNNHNNVGGVGSTRP